MTQYRIHREIQLRPRAQTSYIGQNHTSLITGRDGFIDPKTEQGLFIHKTRILSAYRYLLNGEQPLDAGLSNVDSYSWQGYYIVQPPTQQGEDRISGPGGSVTQHTVELQLRRTVVDGLREQVRLTNYTQEPVRLSLELLFDSDFADLSEAGGKRQQKGRTEHRWQQLEPDTCQIVFDYRAHNTGKETQYAEIHRQAVIRVQSQGTPATKKGKGLAFDVELASQGQWRAEVTATAVIEGEELNLDDEHARKQATFLDTAATFSCSSRDLVPVVVRTLEQARHDLASLRFYQPGRRQAGWTLAAGQPVYSEFFGRDTLTASWQAAMIGPEMMSGTLRELARWQGKAMDDWRDEQPGKMPHQVSKAPAASLGFNPFDRYYGSITTSGFYPLVVSQLWHWTGDKQLIEPFVDAALRGLEFLDRYADLDGDGFYEYQTRSSRGLKNQAWKDSDDAIVYEDGSQVPAPIATCEEQAFVYIAKFHLSEVLWRVGRHDEAKKLYREAGELKSRFNDAFWMEKEGFIGLALDPDNRLVRSITSNPGHCLAAGIVDDSLARRVADRLMAEDLFSGWGIRTLSSAHPAFNPYSYHRGSVWPVEQGTFALGFWRYGLHEHLDRLARAQFEAAALYDFCRPPELFAGHPRDEEHPFPAVYPKACWPQAWSSSALFCTIQAILGLYPYAPLNLLLVDPHLPDWLPEITVSGLRVGGSTVSLAFHRQDDGTSDYEIVDRRGTLHVVRQPSPWSTTSGPLERIVDLFESLTTL